MLNYIWAAMMIVSVLVGGLLGTFDYGEGEGMVQAIWDTAESAVMKIALPLSGIIILWLGIMRIAEEAGLINVIARLIHPILVILFPAIPKGHPAMGAIIMNLAANMLGLGNAATPLGLRAMEELDKLNPHKGVASNEMCMFLAINTSAVTLIPTTAIAYLSVRGVPQAHEIIAPALMATLCSTCAAIIAVKCFESLPAFSVAKQAVDPEVGGEGNMMRGDDVLDAAPEPGKRRRTVFWLAPLVIVMAGVFLLELFPQSRANWLEALGWKEISPAFQVLPPEPTPDQPAVADPVEAMPVEETPGTGFWDVWRRGMSGLSAVAVPFLFLIFIGVGLMRGVRVFEAFVEGAKEGFQVVLRILPFLVGMLVALGMFRASGALAVLQVIFGKPLEKIGVDIHLLPMALMRPLSGSGSGSVLADIASNPDLSNQVKYTAATMYGSTETTFYVLAVYFGAVSIRRTRHALPAGLIADAVGLIAAVVICKWYF